MSWPRRAQAAGVRDGVGAWAGLEGHRLQVHLLAVSGVLIFAVCSEGGISFSGCCGGYKRFFRSIRSAGIFEKNQVLPPICFVLTQGNGFCSRLTCQNKTYIKSSRCPCVATDIFLLILILVLQSTARQKSKQRGRAVPNSTARQKSKQRGCAVLHSTARQKSKGTG